MLSCLRCGRRHGVVRARERRPGGLLDIEVRVEVRCGRLFEGCISVSKKYLLLAVVSWVMTAY